MAVRFSADGQDYTRALALGSQANYTVCCWAKLSVDRNTWSTLWSLDNGTGDVDVVQTDQDGVTLELFSDNFNPQFFAMTVGTWYFVGVSRTNATGTAYYRDATTNTLTTTDLTGGSPTTNMATLRIGESPFGTEWLNGCIAGFKFWTAALSAAEIAQEAMQYAPLRTANLVSFHPFVRTETTDYSGNARTLSGGSGSTTEDGPPIAWHATTSRLIIPAAGAAATNVNVIEATGTGDAQSLGVNVSPNADVAAGTGDAQQPAASVAVAVQAATATGVAQDVSVTTSESAQPQAATATGVAQDVGPSVGAALSAATATGDAQDVTLVVQATVAVADVIGQASDAAASIAVVPATATATGAAFDAVASTATQTNVNVVEAAATGDAQAVSVTTSETATVGAATATGTANDVTITVSASATPGTATATGSGNDVTVIVSPVVPASTGTGDAQPPQASVAPNVVDALSIGQAFDPVISTSLQVPVPVASGTGDAQNVTVTTGNDAVVNVPTATATGVANDLSNTLVVIAVLPATATGDAPDAQVITTVTASPGVASASGSAFNVAASANNDHAVNVGIALATGDAYDPLIIGALPVGRLRRIRGNEPGHRVSGREPRSQV